MVAEPVRAEQATAKPEEQPKTHEPLHRRPSPPRRAKPGCAVRAGGSFTVTDLAAARCGSRSHAPTRPARAVSRRRLRAELSIVAPSLARLWLGRGVGRVTHAVAA